MRQPAAVFGEHGAKQRLQLGLPAVREGFAEFAADRVIRELVLHDAVSRRINTVEQVHANTGLHGLDERIADDVHHPAEGVGQTTFARHVIADRE